MMRVTGDQLQAISQGYRGVRYSPLLVVVLLCAKDLGNRDDFEGLSPLPKRGPLRSERAGIKVQVPCCSRNAGSEWVLT